MGVGDGDDGTTHCDAVGAIVYDVDAEDWVIVVLATPELQLRVTVPPELLVLIDKSLDAEVRVKLPPVELERVATTLVALTTRESATEPDFIVKLIAGEVRETVKSELYVNGAA